VRDTKSGEKESSIQVQFQSAGEGRGPGGLSGAVSLSGFYRRDGDRDHDRDCRN
jgi:hypothetical protein